VERILSTHNRPSEAKKTSDRNSSPASSKVQRRSWIFGADDPANVLWFCALPVLFTGQARMLLLKVFTQRRENRISLAVLSIVRLRRTVHAQRPARHQPTHARPVGHVLKRPNAQAGQPHSW